MTEFAVFAIGASPLLVATDIRDMTEGNLVYYHGCSGPEGTCQVWARRMSDDQVAVALINIDDEQHGIVAQLDRLGMGWTNSTTVQVRDLWEHEDVGTATGSY